MEMNIIKEDIDELNAVLKVRLAPQDYEPKVEGAIRQYQKKASMPGFRQGKVPSGLIRKMYRKSILVEEINKLLNDSIHKYIQDEKLEILGNPLPKAEEGKNIDWDNQKEFEFTYDIGLAPRFHVDVSASQKFVRLKVKTDEELIGKNINELRKRYGSVINPETSEKGDMLIGDFVELDSGGEVKQGGIFKSSSISTDRFKNEELIRSLTGVKKDDQVVIMASWLKEIPEYMAAILGVEAALAETLESDIRFTVKNILRVQEAEIGQELFDKVYGPGIVNGIEEFRSRMRAELEQYYEAESEKRLRHDMQEELLKKLSLSLPDEFLKRWLMAVNEKPLSYEQVSAEYDSYSKALKWQLIENRILKDSQITVNAEEAQNFAREYVRSQFARYGRNDAGEDVVNEAAEGLLKKEEEAKKIYDRIYDNKLMDLFKNKFTIETKAVSVEDFYGHNHPDQKN